ncbi:Tim44-domain-containing protein [Acaromyces ingoldii]|uniref:Mitochondrial import inner membrane translocase subunit TIM44 n=1 Tax=Acaromyces ingoldii TaxID=215250 RepID=A0A316YT07_9BASI|nr:Tim44-domain-containing protein [Acaromyces ingoldii]PWN91153.1 Tim44-domain-containing protein [Acaromyces ingoldii]
MAARSVPRRQQVLRAAATTTTPVLVHSHCQPRPSYHQRVRGFHASPRREQTKSPFQAFVDTLKEELRKSQEMQDNMKQLQGEAGKVQDSETMRRMREAYEKARIVSSIKENPRLQAAADALRKSGGQVGDAVGATLRQMEESELIKGLGAISSRLARQLQDSTAPIRNTEAYKDLSKTLADAFDDGGSALRIYTDASADAATQRRMKREARLRKIGRPMPSPDVEEILIMAADLKAKEKELNKDKVEEDEAEDDPIKAAAQAGAAAGEEGARRAAEEDGTKTTSDASASPEEAASSSAPSSSSSSPSGSAPPPSRPKGYATRVRAQLVANPNAGEALVLRPEPAYKQAWSSFKESNPLMRKLGELREQYEESENPVVERLRSITDTIGGWFEENETARVVGVFRMQEPSFTLDSYQRELREYVIPEIIDAYHGAARHLLRQWCSEATFNVLMATVDPYIQRGMVAHGRLLDLKHIDIQQARMLENNVPVLVVSFATQELMYFKDAKTGKVEAGREDQADACRYVVVLTRLEEEMDNEITGGWKVIEMARRGEKAFL